MGEGSPILSFTPTITLGTELQPQERAFTHKHSTENLEVSTPQNGNFQVISLLIADNSIWIGPLRLIKCSIIDNSSQPNPEFPIPISRIPLSLSDLKVFAPPDTNHSLAQKKLASRHHIHKIQGKIKVGPFTGQLALPVTFSQTHWSTPDFSYRKRFHSRNIVCVICDLWSSLQNLKDISSPTNNNHTTDRTPLIKKI